MAEEEVQQQMEGDEESIPVMVDRSKLTPNMRHYLQMSKLHSQNEYAKGPVGLYKNWVKGHPMSININDVLQSRITAKTIKQRILASPRTFDQSNFFIIELVLEKFWNFRLFRTFR